MPIRFVCQCGRKLQARGEAIGQDFVCPGCGVLVVVPEPNVFRQADPPIDLLAGTSLKGTRKPLLRPGFFKDPVMLIGVVFPSLVLMAFATYLVRDHSTRIYRDKVIGLKVDADRLYNSDPEGAHAKYVELLEFIGPWDPGDDDCRRAKVSARKSRDQLWIRVKPKVEARRLAAEKEAEFKADMARQQAERDRIASFSARVSGGAWIEKKIGSSDILRGLTIAIIPATLPKARLNPILDAACTVKWLEPGIREKYGRLPESYPVDLKPICALLHVAVEGAQGNDSQKFDAFVAEQAWSIMVKKFAIASVETDIDGKYQFKRLSGGSYYLCARWVTEYSFVEWVLSLEVDQSGEIVQDVFNQNAYIIQNKAGE
jgi:hypothetical protein